jgi:predicted RND superfamily exporter protein
VYHFFKKKKVLFYSMVLLSSLVFGFFALKINFEEDITSLLPAVEEGGSEKLVFSNLKVKDKVFVQFNAVSDTVSPEALIEACDAFVEALLEKDTLHNAIGTVLYRLDDGFLETAIRFLYENVPVFLDSSQYGDLEALFQNEHIEKQMQENYTLAASAAGMAFLEMIVQDPVGMRNIFISGMGDMGAGLGGNYTFYDSHIFSPDTTVAIAFISPNFKSFDSKQGLRLSKMIEEEMDSFHKKNSGIEILYHGSPIQGVYNSKRIKQDLLLTISISLVLIFVLLLMCFKNKSTLLYLIAPVLYGTLFALAVVYWVQGSMSLMAVGIGAVIMGVAFSYCLHVITHFKYFNNPVYVLWDQVDPVVLGSLTTIGAFVGLIFTQSELLNDFGLFASLGVAGTALFCLFFLPQFFNTKNNKKRGKAFDVIEKINAYPVEKHRWLIVLIVAVSVFCIAISSRVGFDSDLRNLGYHHKKIVRSQNLLASKTTNNYSTVYFAASSSDLDSALVSAKKLCQKLDKQVKQHHIQGYSTMFSLFIPMEEQQKRIERWNAFWTSDKKEEVKRKIETAASRHGFTSGTFTPFYNMLDYEYEPVSLYDAEILPEELQENIIEFSGDKYLVFIPVRMDKQQVVEVGDAVIDKDPNHIVIDPMYYTSDMVKMVHNDFNLALGITTLFVLIVLLISYKSILLAAIAFLPMGLSWYIVLGFMAVFGMNFNLINIVISAFIFGVGVDYSIFIMDGLLEKYRRNDPVLTYHKTAIFFSAVILIIVISSLLFAIHPAISSIGASTLVGMISTIMIAYILQPYLFSVLVTNRAKQGKAPLALDNLFTTRNEWAVRQIKNNYLYKRHKVERLLKKELRQTTNYSLLTHAAKDKAALLDYGCGNGYASYWAALQNNQMHITGFDLDKEYIALSDNCYQKTSLMTFTVDVAVLEENYDLLILQKEYQEVDEKILNRLFSNAKTILVRKAIAPRYSRLLDTYSFVQDGEDELFVRYNAKNIS